MKRLNNVIAIKDTPYLKSWKYQISGTFKTEIVSQRKRLSFECKQKVESVFGTHDAKELIKLAPNGAIDMCKYLKSEHGYSLSECKDKLLSCDLWTPNWDWQNK